MIISKGKHSKIVSENIARVESCTVSNKNIKSTILSTDNVSYIQNISLISCL